MRRREIAAAFWMDEDVAELSYPARLLFMGLWCLADREGRLEDRPAFIRAQCFPYEPDTPVAGLLDELAAARRHRPGGFITRYMVGDHQYISVRSFGKYQRPHPHETESQLPPAPLLQPLVANVITRPTNESECKPVPSVPSVPSEPSWNGPSDRPPPAGRLATATAARKKPRPDTWLSPYASLWMARWGPESEPPFGEMARELKTAETKLGSAETVARFERFLAAAERPDWARPRRFIEGLGTWSAHGPPSAPQRPSAKVQQRSARMRALVTGRVDADYGGGVEEGHGGADAPSLGGGGPGGVSLPRLNLPAGDPAEVERQPVAPRGERGDPE